MNLSSDLVSQLVKATGNETKASAETTVYGTIVIDGRTWVKIDGSDHYTPVSTTTDVQDGERVTVLIKDHSAIVTGNLSSPSARTDDVQAVTEQVGKFNVLLAHKADIDVLQAEVARIDDLEVAYLNVEGELKAHQAEIDELVVATAEIDKIKAEMVTIEILDTKYATIESLNAHHAEFLELESTYGEFVELTTTRLDAAEADIGVLEAEKLSAVDAELMYANIDFANITEAAVKKIFADYGVIEELIASDGTITKKLVAVEINGDLIKAGTIQVDKLIVKGDDGKYYSITTDFDSINVSPVEEDTIHGSILVAESVTAEKIRVDDLLAFKATIAGFNIKELEDGTKAIYSDVKNGVNNTTRGTYMDNLGQFAIGDGSNYVKFYKDTDGRYKLAIAASEIVLGTGKTVEESVQEAIEAADIRVGARNLIRNSKTMLFDGYSFVCMSDSGVLGLGELSLLTLGASTGTERYSATSARET